MRVTGNIDSRCHNREAPPEDEENGKETLAEANARMYDEIWADFSSDNGGIPG